MTGVTLHRMAGPQGVAEVGGAQTLAFPADDKCAYENQVGECPGAEAVGSSRQGGAGHTLSGPGGPLDVSLWVPPSGGILNGS